MSGFATGIQTAKSVGLCGGRRTEPTEAKLIAKRLAEELKQPNREAVIDGSRMTFSQLASHYSESRLTEPEYHGDRKISGLRSWEHQRSLLKPLIEHFGNRKVREISPAELDAYKLKRLRSPTNKGEDVRDVVGIHLKLSTMQAMLNYAKRQGWVSSVEQALCQNLPNFRQDREGQSRAFKKSRNFTDVTTGSNILISG